MTLGIWNEESDVRPYEEGDIAIHDGELLICTGELEISMALKWKYACRDIGMIFGIPWQLLDAVIAEESGGDPAVVSKAGAIGLMQIIPKYHPECSENLYNPYNNIHCGAAILKSYNPSGDWKDESAVLCALASYCWGPGNVGKKPRYDQWPQEVQQYCDNIWKLYQAKLEGSNDDQSGD